MASKGKPAARAYVEIGGNDAKLRKVLRDLRKRMNGFFRNITQLAKRAGQAIGVGIAAGIGAALTLAVKFEDVLTRTKGVFQKMSGEAESFARALAGKLGRSVSETLDMVQEIGASFRAAGLSAASSFQLAARTASAAAVLAERLGVNQNQVQSALLQASRGRATGLQRLGLGISPQDLAELAKSLNLDVRDSADQIRLYAAVLERVETNINTNTASIGAALDNGENASQRLSRIYAQLRDQLTDIGQKMLPVFSNMLAGISVILSRVSETFSSSGIGGIARLLLDAAKPFTDVVVAGLRDVFSWVIANLDSLFRTVVHNIGTSVSTAIREATGRGPAQGAHSQIFQPVAMSADRTQTALEALNAHLQSFGDAADEAARKMRKKFEAALLEIQSGAETLRDQIDSELGERARGRSISESAGTFTSGAAFVLERRAMTDAERAAREALRAQEEANDHLDGIEELARQGNQILNRINDSLFVTSPRFA